jgi:hypothetical protein
MNDDIIYDPNDPLINELLSGIIIPTTYNISNSFNTDSDFNSRLSVDNSSNKELLLEITQVLDKIKTINNITVLHNTMNSIKVFNEELDKYFIDLISIQAEILKLDRYIVDDMDYQPIDVNNFNDVKTNLTTIDTRVNVIKKKVNIIIAATTTGSIIVGTLLGGTGTVFGGGISGVFTGGVGVGAGGYIGGKIAEFFI